MLSSNEIRNGFIDFFNQRGHNFVASSPIVPIGDKTLLFANAGMNQFKDIFLGLKQPEYKRVANSQKCLRVSGKHNDLEEVGRDTYHHTFFEMLGNWSFGDYFKAEAIQWAWELLVDVWGIDADKLYVTVFGGDESDGLAPDDEARQLWTKVTPISSDRVLSFGRKDNFWEMGSVGPCGPCSEIHIDLGANACDKKTVKDHKCAVNGGCSRYIELWNLVFIQFNRDNDGKLGNLNANYVDTGAGLERLARVFQSKSSNYDTDLFMPVINTLEDFSGCKYTSLLQSKSDIAFRVIADHIRTLVFAITDGATPSNEGAGYVIRRILRRACRFARELGMHEPFMYKLVDTVTGYMGGAFDEINQRGDYVSTVIKSEEESFTRTLDRGIEIFSTAAAKAESCPGKTVSGEDAFALYDTYGFPFDLTELMAREKGLTVDTKRFNDLMEKQRQRARAAQKGSSGFNVAADTALPVTEDKFKYETDSIDSVVLGFVGQDGFSSKYNSGSGIVLDKTCFYAESGGQIGDIGVIEFDGGRFSVTETIKVADCVVHRGELIKGSINASDNVRAVVYKDRQSTRRNHTATHLLQWALQDVCGKTVSQKGSFVCPDYLRFDFTCPKSLTAEQIKKIEQLVIEKISENKPVHCEVMARKDAEKLGAMALFGEKYGNDVRVVAVGAAGSGAINNAFSKEFCGGTHVDNTGDIGGFKIIKEESISAGVRRITGLTGKGLSKYLTDRSDTIDDLSQKLKVPTDQIIQRVEKLILDNKDLSKQLKSAAKNKGDDILDQARKLLGDCEKCGTSSVVTGLLESADIEQARLAVDMIKKKAVSAAVIFGLVRDGGVSLIIGVTEDLIKCGLKAGDIIKQIAPAVDGRGGGRDQFAQAGGKNPDGLAEALSIGKKMILEKLRQ